MKFKEDKGHLSQNGLVGPCSMTFDSIYIEPYCFCSRSRSFEFEIVFSSYGHDITATVVTGYGCSIHNIWMHY